MPYQLVDTWDGSRVWKKLTNFLLKIPIKRIFTEGKKAMGSLGKVFYDWKIWEHTATILPGRISTAG